MTLLDALMNVNDDTLITCTVISVIAVLAALNESKGWRIAVYFTIALAPWAVLTALLYLPAPT